MMSQFEVVDASAPSDDPFSDPCKNQRDEGEL
jgi:hypothetical protein